jgi:hypothetical protein
MNKSLDILEKGSERKYAQVVESNGASNAATETCFADLESSGSAQILQTNWHPGGDTSSADGVTQNEARYHLVPSAHVLVKSCKIL